MRAWTTLALLALALAAPSALAQQNPTKRPDDVKPTVVPATPPGDGKRRRGAQATVANENAGWIAKTASFVAPVPKPLADPEFPRALEALRKAAESRDVAGLLDLLAPDVARWTGGIAPTFAAPRPNGDGKGALPDRLFDVARGRLAPSAPRGDKLERLFVFLERVLAAGGPPGFDRAVQAQCLPAAPTFERARAEKLRENAGVDATSPIGILHKPLVLRREPADKAEPSVTLPAGRAVLPIAPSDVTTRDVPDDWSAFVLVGGDYGFAPTASVGLLAEYPEQICWRRVGKAWKVVALIDRTPFPPPLAPRAAAIDRPARVR